MIHQSRVGKRRSRTIMGVNRLGGKKKFKKGSSLFAEPRVYRGAMREWDAEGGKGSGKEGRKTSGYDLWMSLWQDDCFATWQRCSKVKRSKETPRKSIDSCWLCVLLSTHIQRTRHFKRDDLTQIHFFGRFYLPLAQTIFFFQWKLKVRSGSRKDQHLCFRQSHWEGNDCVEEKKKEKEKRSMMK